MASGIRTGLFQLSENASARAYFSAVGGVLATAALGFVANRFLSHASLSLLFVTGVLIVSARTGLGPSLIASLLSFLTLNFFFTKPYYTFEVADENEVATLMVFLIVTAITGNLAARMHREIEARRVSLQRTSNLYEFSRLMSSATGTETALKALAEHLVKSIKKPVRVFARSSGGKSELSASAGPPAVLDDHLVEQAWSRMSSEPATIDSWYFVKLVANRKPVGMAAIDGNQLDKGQIDLVRSLCDQAAIAVNRTQLVADLEEAKLTSETEQLRSALLASVSHDLRTPLASIIGSTTSLLEYGDSFSDEDRRELLSTVVDEAKRLDRHIQNLLDMTRLGYGRLRLHRDWVELHDIISGAINRMRDAFKDLRILIDIPTSIPLLWVHGALIEQAFVNVLDNAASFSPTDGCVSITATQIQDRVEVDICDDGPGIPREERERIFDMFHTVPREGRSDRQGTGLGLAICRGIIAAHGGTITATDNKGAQGTCIHITLPLSLRKAKKSK